MNGCFAYRQDGDGKGNALSDQIDDSGMASGDQPEHTEQSGLPALIPQPTPVNPDGAHAVQASPYQRVAQQGYASPQPLVQPAQPIQPQGYSFQPSAQPSYQPYRQIPPYRPYHTYPQPVLPPRQAPSGSANAAMRGVPYPYPPVPPIPQVPVYPSAPYQTGTYLPQAMPQSRRPAWKPQRVLTYAQQVRRAVGREARLVLFYCVVMTAVALVAQMTIATVMILQGTSESAIDGDAFINRISGAVSLIALVGCAIYLALMRSRDPLWHGLPRELWLELAGRGQRAHRTMTPVVFLISIMLILGASDVYSFVLEPALDWLSGLFGAKPDTAMDSIDASMGTLAMVLYAGFFGPIMEELLFRGLVMPALARYGKVFSIVTSAVLFGFFHTDLLQGAYAILVGLVLGYIATEYGLVWSIALHITNNFVFSDLLSRLLAVMPQTAQDVVGFGLYILVGIGSLLYLILRRGKIREYMQTNRSLKGTLAACWSSPWFLVFLGLSFVFACVNGFTTA